MHLSNKIQSLTRIVSTSLILYCMIERSCENDCDFCYNMAVQDLSEKDRSEAIGCLLYVRTYPLSVSLAILVLFNKIS